MLNAVVHFPALDVKTNTPVCHGAFCLDGFCMRVGVVFLGILDIFCSVLSTKTFKIVPIDLNEKIDLSGLECALCSFPV